MITIAEVADKIGMHICERGEMKEQFKVVAYGVEIVLGLSITVFCILLCGALVGMFNETLYVLLISLVMKYIIGGPHLSGFTRCIGLSALLILFFAWLSKNFIYLFSCPVSLGLFIIAAFCILNYAPLMTFNDNGDHRFEKKSRRALALALLIGGYMLLVLSDAKEYKLIFSGLLFSIFNISPMGLRLTNFIEKITKGGNYT